MRVEVEIVLACVVAVIAFALAAAVSTAARSHVPDLALGAVLVLYVVAVAQYAGMVYAIPVGAVSIEAYDWYFLPPLRSLDRATTLLLAIVIITSVLIAEIAERAVRRASASEAAWGVLADEQEALRHVATLVARQGSADEIFATVAEEVGKLLQLDTAQLYRYESELMTVVAAWGIQGPVVQIGTQLVLDGDSVATRALWTRRPSRIDDYSLPKGATADYVRSLGVRSAVGTPILVDGHVWGLLTAASLCSDPLPPRAELRIEKFAELVATAIANAEARTEIARLAEEQAALRRVATLVARSVQPSEVFAAVAEELGRVLGVEGTMVFRYESDATATLLARWGVVDDDGLPIGSNRRLDGDGVIARVYRTGSSTRFDNYREASGELGTWARGVGVHAAVGAPIVVDDQLWGIAAAATRTDSLPQTAEARIASFAELIATAISNAENRSELTASRARVVAASDETRKRIERDLHDGIQQRLVSLALKIRMTETMTPRPWNEIQRELSLLADDLVAALEELREISRGIHPAILSEGGLEPALKALARRCPIPVALDARIDSRLDEALEVTAYYVVSEAFTNAVKYAEASVLELGVEIGDDYLALSIRDDGLGGADPSRGSGLVGLTDRVEALGGTLSVVSPPGGGTALHVLLPLAPDTRSSFEAVLGEGVAKARSEPNAERRPVSRDNLSH
ncbi:MAG TPA: GAF domain-containing protein [Gaiellaceae bacterium]|nr:GAF domain-containing protein [Gaiellaceae bacterium]